MNVSLKDLTREDLEFIANWLMYYGKVYRRDSIGHIEDGFEWLEPDHEWLAIDDIFNVVHYGNDMPSVILWCKGIHDGYDQAMSDRTDEDSDAD